MKPLKKEAFSISVNEENAEIIFLALLGLGYKGYDYAVQDVGNCFYTAQYEGIEYPSLHWEGDNVFRAAGKTSIHFETFQGFMTWYFDKGVKSEARKELEELQKQIESLRKQAGVLESKLKD